MPDARPVSVPAVIGGSIFIVVWLGGAASLAMMKFIVGVMANDSGAASAEAHERLLLGLMSGQLLTALAGIPAGLAFFWRTKRKPLLWTFAAILIVGIVAQVAAFYSFAS